MHPFTQTDLLEAAGVTSYERGVAYLDNVSGLVTEDSHAQAIVFGTHRYECQLSWARELAGRCSCPFNAEGYFCKHLVAVGLAVLEHGTGSDRQPDIDAWLKTLSRKELVELVRELAILSQPGVRMLATRAAIRENDAPDAQQSILEEAQAQLSFGEYLDWRAADDIADVTAALLHEYESALSDGPDAADAVRPALEYVLWHIRNVSLEVDDSNGALGDALAHAVSLHARSCEVGNPDPIQVANWLVKYRRTSPGWPETPLSLYEKVFDAESFEVYRQGILEAARSDQAGISDFSRRQWILELADHDNDLDAAIVALSEYSQIYYREIVVRLRNAGRIRESFDWLDRGIAAGIVTTRDPNQFWFAIDEVIDWLDEDGQQDRATELLRTWFSQKPEVARYSSLIRYARKMGTLDLEEAWVRKEAERLAKRNSDGDLVIAIALEARDLDWAWSAYERLGSRFAWKKLAQASADTRPRQSADLYRPHLEETLLIANTRVYPEVARSLVTMRSWYVAAGATREFNEFLAGIRSKYKNRPALMRELNSAGLR